MKNVFLSIICMFALFGGWAWAQGQPYNHFDIQAKLPLSAQQEIALPELQISVKTTHGKQIKLTPQDIGSLPQSRYLSLTTDTLPPAHGKTPCRTTCVIDTLFVGDGIFLLSPKVVVEYYTDGTFDGTSSFGWETLRDMADCQAPAKDRTGSYVIALNNVRAANLSLQARQRIVLNICADVSNRGYALFSTFRAQELRVIRCSDTAPIPEWQTAAAAAMTQCEQLVTTTSVDPKVPPANAINYVPAKLTLRHFEDKYADQAAALAELLGFLLDIAPSNISVQDMLPAYGGTTPIPNYLELWLK